MDGVDIRAHHFHIAGGIGAIGIKGLGQPQTAVVDEGAQGRRVRSLFGEHDGHPLLAELGEGAGEAGGVRHLLAGESLDGYGLEAVVVAEVAEGGVGGGEHPLRAGDAGYFPADPAAELVELLAVALGAGGVVGGVVGIGFSEVLLHDRDCAAETIDRMPPVGIPLVGRVLVLRVIAAAGEGRQLRADLDQRGWQKFAQRGEVGFQAEATGEHEVELACIPELGGRGCEMVRVTVRAQKIDHLDLGTAHLAGEIPEQGMKHRHSQLGEGAQTGQGEQQKRARHRGAILENERNANTLR